MKYNKYKKSELAKKAIEDADRLLKELIEMNEDADRLLKELIEMNVPEQVMSEDDVHAVLSGMQDIVLTPFNVR